MTKELVISSNAHETRVAVMEDDQLVEIYFQRSNEYSLAGSIHKGRVTRVLPGMQSAFVDLGLERDTFLYVSDFFEENDEIEKFPDEQHSSRSGRQDRSERYARSTQQDRTPPPAPEAAEAQHVEPDATGTEAPAPGVSSSPAVVESDNDRDRRGGRRSRRRRGRGRGFPDSKYASPDERRESEPEPIEEPEAAAGEDDILILPGESLRKYRGPARVAELAEDTETEESLETTDLIESTVESAESEISEETENGDADDAEEHPPTNAIPDAPAHGEAEDVPEIAAEHETDLEEDAGAAEELGEEPVVIGPEAETTAADTGVAVTRKPLGSGVAVAAEPEPISEQEPAAIETGDVAVETDADDNERPSPDEDPDIREMILGAGPVGEGPEQAHTESETGAGPTLASVRDQGGRYLHRMSRRMRRRMRNEKGAPEQHIRPDRSRPEPVPEPVRAEPVAPAASRTERDRPERERSPQPSITDLLKEGQEILVQIAKEPLGQKGARITSHIALPGRYVVYMPTLDHMGVSRKIASDDERLRLKKILQKHREGILGGFIIRTAGEGRSEEEIAADMSFLANLWIDIRQRAEKRKAPALLHHDLDIVQRILRDQLNESFKSIWVDNEEMYESVLRFMQRFQPPLVGRVKMYTRAAPIFDAFSITNELEKALRPKVWLKSGGYIVINQTEALVAIDINTGKFVGKSNRLEDTIVKTNTEAVKEIVRQIRLRDLGGIIVIDFIDMDERKNRQKVMQALEDAMRADRAPYKVLQFNDFGLVAITRKRVKQSLERTLCSPCPYCEGAGYVKSVQTVISEILVEAQKIVKAVEGTEVVLRVHPDVAKVLKSTHNRYLEEIEEILKRPVLVVADAAIHHEKYDLA